MTRAVLAALALSLAACGDPTPKVVTKIERVWPAGPPAGACETQPTPDTAGLMDWKKRAVIYAGAAAIAIEQLALCDQWIRGWKADEAAAGRRP